MIEFYPEIKWVHILCVMLSGTLFATRGILMLLRSRHANHAAARYLSYAIDTTLLTAALMLVTILHQYPFAQSWLTVKIFLIAIYIALGSFALKQGTTRRIRATCYVPALAVYLFIVTVAYFHNPLGIFGVVVAR